MSRSRRRRGRGPSRRRDKTGDARAAATKRHSAGRSAEGSPPLRIGPADRRLEPRRPRGRDRHPTPGLAHGFFHVISAGWDDLLVGYPIAAALGIAGAVVLSKA
jgi:hypothetical protein